MRRAAVQAFRTARRIPLRRVIFTRALPISSVSHGLGARPASSAARRDAPNQILLSSMYIRSFSVAAFVSVLASGLWYYQRDHLPESRALVNGTSVVNSGSGLSPPQYSTLASASGSLPSSAQSPPPASGPEPTTESKRRQLIVEDDVFYIAELSEDTPLSKQAENQGNNQLQMLTSDQATQRLRKQEESYLVGRGNGVVRYDIVQIPSNNPIEDDHAEKIVSVPQTVAPTQDGSPSSDWMFWGVFDGHSGWTTSAKLRQVLISYVARELNNTYKSAVADASLNFPTPQSIDAAIKRGFVALDHEIVNASVQKAMSKNTKLASTELLAPALSGSCALLSFYDSSTNLFRVACTGDSRAVLGRKMASGNWTATPLSEDQTGGTPSEAARLRVEHPDEEFVVHRGRILGGLEPSRAFGDAGYKWSREVQEKIKKYFFGRTPNPLLKTPPYVTAEPIITTTKVEPENGDFVVLATDGLWEMLTNEEVVGLVGRWLEAQKAGTGNGGGGAASWAKSFLSSTKKELPVEKAAQQAQTPAPGGGKGQRAPIRQVQWDVKDSHERFVVEDKNVATHLVRNALGGRDNDLVCALLSLVSPYSRRYRYVVSPDPVLTW